MQCKRHRTRKWQIWVLATVRNLLHELQNLRVFICKTRNWVSWAPTSFQTLPFCGLEWSRMSSNQDELVKEKVVGFGLGNQTESITLNIIITESNIKRVLDFSLKEQKLLSLLHPSLGIQKIILNGQIFAWSFVTPAFVLQLLQLIVSEKFGYFLLFSERNQSHWWVKFRNFGSWRHNVINFGIFKEEPSPFSGMRNLSYPVFIKVLVFVNRLVAWETHGKNFISGYKVFSKENFLWAKLKSLTSPYGDASVSHPHSHSHFPEVKKKSSS